MDVKEIKKLLDAVAAAEISELVLETGDVKLTVKRDHGAVVEAPAPVQAPAAAAPVAPETSVGAPAPAQAPAPAGPASGPAPAVPEAPEAETSHLVEVSAPIVGTFYEASAPDAAAYVKVGDRVKAGTVLCIIEAMKLMNEIEAETSGTVAEILVRNEEPVEYGQVLFRIDPD